MLAHAAAGEGTGSDKPHASCGVKASGVPDSVIVAMGAGELKGVVIGGMSFHCGTR